MSSHEDEIFFYSKISKKIYPFNFKDTESNIGWKKESSDFRRKKKKRRKTSKRLFLSIFLTSLAICKKYKNTLPVSNYSQK